MSHSSKYLFQERFHDLHTTEILLTISDLSVYLYTQSTVHVISFSIRMSKHRTCKHPHTDIWNATAWIQVDGLQLPHCTMKWEGVLTPPLYPQVLSDENVVHFDLKCDNILLEALPLDGKDEMSKASTDEALMRPLSEEPPFRVILADFGESRMYGSPDDALTVR